eukprot:Rmarinus@m.27656
MSPYIEPMDPNELADMIRKGIDPSKIVIIDVRDEDYYGGNIMGSINVPSEQFETAMHKLVDQHKDADMVIFHCMQSQMRGPHCAAMMSKALQRQHPESKTSVKVLYGGFMKWVYRFYAESSLIENLDLPYWKQQIGIGM